MLKDWNNFQTFFKNKFLSLFKFIKLNMHILVISFLVIILIVIFLGMCRSQTVAEAFRGGRGRGGRGRHGRHGWYPRRGYWRGRGRRYFGFPYYSSAYALPYTYGYGYPYTYSYSTPTCEETASKLYKKCLNAGTPKTECEANLADNLDGC